MPELNTQVEKTEIQTEKAVPIPVQPNYSIPVQIPADLFNKLVSLSNDGNVSVSAFCLELIQSAVNFQLLSQGTISDISDDAQEVFKGLSFDAMLEALRIYNVAKGPVPEGEAETPAIPGTLAFTVNQEATILIKQINERRALKGLAPLEKSLCEILYHYGISLGESSVFEAITGMKTSKFKSTVKTLALNERETNGAKSNVIEAPSIFSSYTIVETPVTETDGKK